MEGVYIFMICFFVVLPSLGALGFGLYMVINRAFEHREVMAQMQLQQVSGNEIVRLNSMNQMRAIDFKNKEGDTETVYLAGDPADVLTNMVLVRSNEGGYQLLGNPREVSRNFTKYDGLDQYLEDEYIRRRIADRSLDEKPQLGDRSIQ